MQYLKPSFSLPASSGKVTQEEWDRIFGVPEKGSSDPDEGTEKTTFGRLLPE